MEMLQDFSTFLHSFRYTSTPLARARPYTYRIPDFLSTRAASARVAPVVKISSQRCPYLIQSNDSQNFEHPVCILKKNRWILILTLLFFLTPFSLGISLLIAMKLPRSAIVKSRFEELIYNSSNYDKSQF